MEKKMKTLILMRPGVLTPLASRNHCKLYPGDVTGCHRNDIRSFKSAQSKFNFPSQVLHMQPSGQGP